VKIDASRIVDWRSFHEVFKEAFGFPGFYGRTMDGWIDCLSCLDEANSGMTDIHIEPGGVVTLVIDNVADFATRCPEQYAAVIECAAFVNWRRIEIGEPAVLALAFNK